ncbi:MAG: calcineurin-like phosphoesterase C-terminal domain-containing protein [Marinifilaceae bacterium]|jgi:hypothetical protein|nr:calcineurin-like phosphoesterase C-terminal domain-containing protein [Marinifilaceae bacterium]
MNKKILLIVLVFISSISLLYAKKISGYTYEDVNRNGKFDKKDKLLKNVLVFGKSNFTISNKKAFFVLEDESDRFISAVAPPKFQAFNPKSKLINSKVELSKDSDSVYIGFVRSDYDIDKEMRLNFIGDVQVNDSIETKYAISSIYSELANSNSDLDIYMGDLVNENPNLIQGQKDIIEQIGRKYSCIFGNHDRNLNSDNQVNKFEDCFGSQNFAYNVSNNLIVGINNIFPESKKGYKAQISEFQIRLIEQLAKLYPNQNLILCMHAPLKYSKNKDLLLTVLQNCKNILVISAHMHTFSRNFHACPNGKIIHEINCGATCGNFWRGEKNIFGVPASIMQCGSPRGYLVLNIKANGVYDFKYKMVNGDKIRQMSIWYKNQDSLNLKIEDFDVYDNKTLLVNLYAASDSTQLYAYIGNKKIKCQKIKVTDPFVRRIVYLNKNKLYPSGNSNKAVLRKSKSNHIWKLNLDENLLSKTSRINFIAYDKYGLNIKQSFIIKP